MDLSRLRQWAFVIKQDIMALYFAVKDPKTPTLAKIIGACVVVYAFSPIDLIPDFIPVLGLLDDLILLPIGIILTVKLIPSGIMADARYRALQVTNLKHPHSWIAAVIIIMVWSMLFFMLLLAWWY